MKFKNVIACLIGLVFAFICLVGVLLLIPVKGISVTIAVVVICLSLAAGLLVHDLMSLAVLITGILILFIPAWIIGILYIFIGIAGAICNFLICGKELRTL